MSATGDSFGRCSCCGWHKFGIADGGTCRPCAESPLGQPCGCGNPEVRSLTPEAAMRQLERRYAGSWMFP